MGGHGSYWAVPLSLSPCRSPSSPHDLCLFGPLPSYPPANLAATLLVKRRCVGPPRHRPLHLQGKACGLAQEGGGLHRRQWGLWREGGGACAGPCGWGGRVWGGGGEAVPAVLSRVAGQFPRPRRPVLGGCRIPWVVVQHLSVRAPDTVSTPPRAWRLGPVVPGFAPGTQLMGRAGEYSGCSVVWCGTVWHCVVGRRSAVRSSDLMISSPLIQSSARRWDGCQRQAWEGSGFQELPLYA